MTPEDRKRIFDYCGWCERCSLHGGKCNGIEQCFVFDFDAIDAAESVKVMVEKGEWDGFIEYCCKHSSGIVRHGYVEVNIQDFIAYLFDPANFFSLLAAWLKGKP
jgi:hypothetical protein